jgi:hypothetical protein
VVDEEGVSRGLAAPGRGGRGGVAAGSGTVVVGATALDLRLEPNPRPLKREFRELIRRCSEQGR